ncbi:pentatricopeptide repeat-containing protein At1g30610, chloroplastic-like [Salvia splendens]|uniref:pentatricopeptide repeat-containing protein At1g30610, chloroplastic-like n=1 Tax=Salvia splendens TaxID=180675 RepID=UPI001C251CFB|nr:pentatricopeptide repeat-containing protein At1g30610, chloroplastic-like [Salvia splendens]
MMLGGFSASESAAEFLLLSRNSLPLCGFPILRRHVSVAAPRREKQRIIAARSALNDGVALDKEFEFTPSFSEYLKAMEFLKNEKYQTLKSSDSGDVSSNRSRGRKVVKKIEEKSGGELSAAEENSRKGKRGASYRGDSKEGDFRDSEMTGRRQGRDRDLRIRNRKMTDGGESESLSVERDAFKPLENGEGVVGGPRVTRVDMEERIQKLAKCLNGADIDIPEWKFSEIMRSAQIRFSDHSILRVVQILGKLGNWKRVLQLIEWLQSRDRFKCHRPRYICTAALDALGKARRPVEALNLFYRMQGQMATYPDIAAYHCIAVTLGQAGYMKELFDVIDTMRSHPKKKFKTELLAKWDPRLEPDIIVYNAVLNACVRRQKWEGAFWVLQQLSEQNQQPSSTTYGLVMEVMLACGKYNLVYDFFKKVQKSYIPNALIYKVLINALWKEGKVDEAIMAVDEMERRGIVGTAGLYYDLARCLCSAGRCSEALKQIDKICRVANKPLVITYTGLMQACVDSGDVENAAYIFNHMQKFCSPNLVTCNIMLKAFLDHGKFEDAKQLFLTLLDNGNNIRREEDYRVRVIPDIYTFNTMLDACAAEKRWGDLEFVYVQMLRYGHHFNAKRHLRIILEAQRAGEESILEMTWKRLVETKRPPPPLLVTEMFCTRLSQGDYAAALSYVVNFAFVESHVFSRKSWSKVLTENAHRFPDRALDQLVQDGNILLHRSENPALEHLLDSCKDHLRKQALLDVREIVRTGFQNNAALVC